MLSWVFFAQPVGQLLANVLSLAAVAAYKPWIEKNQPSCKASDLECFRAIDRLWRLVIGIGIVPAILALVFRFTIPESPRYTLDILQNSRGTLEDTAHYFGAPEASLEFGEAEMLHIPTRTTAERICSNPSSSSSVIAPEEIIRTDSDSESQPGDAYSQPSAAQSAPFSPGEPEFVPPLASWEDAKNFFITEKNWQYLLGTSLAWLFLDFACEYTGIS